MSLNVAIVDYGMGNLYSMAQAMKKLRVAAVVTSRANQIREAAAVILPGVGAFGPAMANLRARQLTEPIQRFAETGRPVFGICLGMQLLFGSSEEHGHHEGLGLVPGRVVKFPAQTKDGQMLRVPNIGWRPIHPPAGDAWSAGPLKRVRPGTGFYFVHSYHAEPAEQNAVAAVSEYGLGRFCAAVSVSNIFATQFHPEKSGREGINLLRSWLEKHLLLEESGE